MKHNSINQFLLINIIIISFAVLCPVRSMYSQTADKDTTFHPYHVNYWITGGVIVAGAVAEKIGVPWISGKNPVTSVELQNLDRNDFSVIDRWELRMDPSNMSYYVGLSDQMVGVMAVLPALTMLDKNIRSDWLDVLLMYAETVVITNDAYLYLPFGPTFQNRFRPLVYYDALGMDVRTRGSNRNSLYSGHVASGASASFFTAKIFCDYHPDLGWKQCLVYGAASIPPLILSYVRLKALSHFPSDIIVGFGVGALCGILIPELHRIRFENASLGLYSSFEGTGIRVQWKPDFGK